MSIVDFNEFKNKRSETSEIDWLREVKRELQKNYRKMFDGNNPEFEYLWQMYVDIDENLENFKEVCNKYLVNKKVEYDKFKIECNVIQEKSRKVIDLKNLSSGEKQIL